MNRRRGNSLESRRSLKIIHGEEDKITFNLFRIKNYISNYFWPIIDSYFHYELHDFWEQNFFYFTFEKQFEYLNNFF